MWVTAFLKGKKNFWLQNSQGDVVLVVGLVVASFHRYASRAEAVFCRDQSLRYQRVTHALANFARDKFRQHIVGGLIGESVVEIAQPDGEARVA